MNKIKNIDAELTANSKSKKEITNMKNGIMLGDEEIAFIEAASKCEELEKEAEQKYVECQRILEENNVTESIPFEKIEEKAITAEDRKFVGEASNLTLHTGLHTYRFLESILPTIKNREARRKLSKELSKYGDLLEETFAKLNKVIKKLEFTTKDVDTILDIYILFGESICNTIEIFCTESTECEEILDKYQVSNNLELLDFGVYCIYIQKNLCYFKNKFE